MKEQSTSQLKHTNINPQLIAKFRFPKSLQIGLQPPTLNKIQSGQNSFYCGYSNGMILQYTYQSLHNYHLNQQAIKQKSSYFQYPSYPQHKQVYYPYQNCDVIDIDIFSRDILLTCTHTEVTLLNMVKNKRISLRGHQQSPIAVSSHPISPLVVSVSNLVIQHDLRMQKPILVNYITPPVYDVKFFPDGQFYLLSGQPIRVGKDKWMRTLQNGISTMSKNSKFILSNDMNSNITLWDWRKSQKLREIKNVKNQDLNQPIHFLSKQSINSQILFLQDDGNLLHHDIINNKTERHKVLQPESKDNWKCQISAQTQTTKHILLYQHSKTQIQCYNLK